MKKFFGIIISVTILTMGLVIPVALGAAGKPSLNKKSAEIIVGKTIKLKAKNINNKAKIKWKSGNKSIAKIAKKASKGRVAYIKGVKAGNVVIKMTYTIGKKSKTLKCKVTVVEENVNGTDANSSNGNNNNGSSSNNSQGNTSKPTATPGTTPSGGDNVTPTTAPSEPTAAPTSSPDDPNPTESPGTSPTATPAPGGDEGKLTDHEANGSEAEIPFDDIFKGK